MVPEFCGKLAYLECRPISRLILVLSHGCNVFGNTMRTREKEIYVLKNILFHVTFNMLV